MLALILLAALAESAASFAGAFLVIFRDSFARFFAHRILGFAIGALIGVSFFELIPEAIGEIGFTASSPWLILGIVAFFAIEKLLRWYHHHEGHEDEIRPYASLILLGDAIHNFIDGIILAIGFLVSFPVGVTTTIAVILHEIPQEVADFSVLIRGGYSRRRALWANFLISLTTLGGALVGYFFGSTIEAAFPYLLAFIAGSFLYIAMSDLIPETHEETGLFHLVAQLLLLIAGAAIMYILATYLAE